MYYSRKDEIDRLKEEEPISFKEFMERLSSYIKKYEDLDLYSVLIDSNHTGLQNFEIPWEHKKLEIILKMNKDRSLKVDGSPIFKAYFDRGKIYMKGLMV